MHARHMVVLRKRMLVAAASVALLVLFCACREAATPSPSPQRKSRAGLSPLRVPVGFRVTLNAVPEPYTNTGWAKEIIHEKTGVEMVFVPAGEFQMGSDGSFAQEDESPVHPVRITKPFYLGKYEVTQAQWKKVMAENPSHFNGDWSPVEEVSWNACQEFLEKAGDTLRLPTEAEWEYACRATSSERFFFGRRSSPLAEYAWYADNSGDTTHLVGLKKPNAWGLYDMYGNAWEWCTDWYEEGYPEGEQTDPKGPSSGVDRVLRGGSWLNFTWICTSANRLDGDITVVPSYGNHGTVGFRLAVDASEEAAILPASSGTKPQGSLMELQVPPGFGAAPGTPAEPYTGTGWAKEVIHKTTGIRMVFVPAGEFMMGSDEPEYASDAPQHGVRLTTAFYMSKYEVTQKQWVNLMGEQRTRHGAIEHMKYSGEDGPIDLLTWDECRDFVTKASDGLRLPSEAEWEYACRAGTTTAYYTGDNEADLGMCAWYVRNSDGSTHGVGLKEPNAWGLYDMLGNVREWVNDYIGIEYAKEAVDPQGPDQGSTRVLRGGSFTDRARDCHVAERHASSPDRASGGFRVACDLSH